MLSLIVHGGAWDIPGPELDAHRTGCSVALKIGWNILREGGSAVDAVEQTIRFLENDEAFDAGRGSHLNAVGAIELDASIMNGLTLRCGAVAAVQGVRNPIMLARKVMDASEHVLLVGEGAVQFAREHSVEVCRPEELITERERERWNAVRAAKDFSTRDAFRRNSSDTVGAVAMDSHGVICAGTSTGGTLNKYPGRVGDSPLIGSGTYADREAGGVSTTGWGEAMIKVVMAKTVVDLMAASGGHPQEAAEKGIEILKRKAEGFGGIIALDRTGHPGVAFNTPHMARAYVTAEMSSPFVAV